MADESRNHATSNSAPRKGYDPITLEDVRNAHEEPLFAGLETTSARTIGGILFLVILVLSQRALPVTAVVLVVLLACVLYRMDKRERQVAAIPLTFSAIRLGFQISEQLYLWQPRTSNVDALTDGRIFESGLHWLPLFFCAYLFYSPWKQSYTSRGVFWYSMVLLLSGFLPGDGYLYICSFLFYTLFVALIITLILDLHPKVFGADSQGSPQRVQPVVS